MHDREHRCAATCPIVAAAILGWDSNLLCARFGDGEGVAPAWSNVGHVGPGGDQVNRRKAVFFAGLAAGAAPMSALAQAGGPPRRIGFLGFASAQTDAPFLSAFRAGMLELRWVEGRDYAIESRFANGVTQAMPGLAAELVATRRKTITGAQRPAEAEA